MSARARPRDPPRLAWVWRLDQVWTASGRVGGDRTRIGAHRDTPAGGRSGGPPTGAPSPWPTCLKCALPLDRTKQPPISRPSHDIHVPQLTTHSTLPPRQPEPLSAKEHVIMLRAHINHTMQTCNRRAAKPRRAQAEEGLVFYWSQRERVAGSIHTLLTGHTGAQSLQSALTEAATRRSHPPARLARGRTAPASPDAPCQATT